MKLPLTLLVCLLAGAIVCPVLPGLAKPPSAVREPAKTSKLAPEPGDPATELALARWLLQSNGLTLPLGQVVSALSGKSVMSFDPAQPGDAAVMGKISAALDGILPVENRPDSAARSAAALADADAVAACFTENLRAALQPGTAPTPQPLSASHAYPAFATTDPTTGKCYYLSTLLYPVGGEPDGSAMQLASESADQFTADGCCLLVGIEYNGKLSRDVAFLNWRIIDLSKLRVFFKPSFQASGKDALTPSAVLTDGRKGRD